jgi:hypothetical protein
MEMTMKTAIKLALLAALGGALLAIPASAESAQRRQVRSAPTLQYRPAQDTFQNDTVMLGGEYIGQDPDANVRGELLKNESTYNGNAY